MPVQVRARVRAVEPVGAYLRLALHAPGVADGFAPGQFLAVAVGGPVSAMLLRRAFSLHRVEGDEVQVVFAVHGPGTAWLADRSAGDVVDVVGPLGRPFGPAGAPGDCVVVGGGYGAAPLGAHAADLRRAGHRVHALLGAADAARVFGADPAAYDSLALTTEDGSAGVAGRVTDVLPGLLRRTGAGTVHACGPMGMLRAVHEVARAHGAASRVAVEEAMACGIGICMTCVLPVVGADGMTRMARSCVDGPVFDGSAVRWDDVGGIPPEAVGAPVAPEAVGAPVPAEAVGAPVRTAAP